MPPSQPASAPATLPARQGAPRRLLSPALIVAVSPLVAVVVALSIGGVFIASIGQNPFEIYALMLRESFGTGYGLGQTLFRATPLVFTGLAVAVGFRAGLFNIGVEGQLYLGGFAAAMVGCTLAGWPAPLLLPLAMLGDLVPALKGPPANLSLVIAIATAIAAGVLLFRTRRGYELRAVGLNAPAAE